MNSGKYVLLRSTLSIFEIMQILGISAFDKTPIIELLTEFQVNSNQNVKEQMNLPAASGRGIVKELFIFRRKQRGIIPKEIKFI